LPFLILALIGCGGGGGGSSGSPPAKTVPSIIRWVAPTQYTDNTALNPLEIQYFNIYVNNCGPFLPTDNAIVSINAVDNNGYLAETKFDLTKIDQAYLALNNVTLDADKCVAVTAETYDGEESDFSISVYWGDPVLK
jgi:hypothetical protein